MNTLSKAPKVSVCVIAYNQEKYIRQCLQSIVNQSTSFDFEVIVGEDCSTDGTRAIVQEFIAKYPGLVRGIFHDKNVGGCKNYESVHSAALGQYISHVDGDDLCCPSKLSHLADYLDLNHDCVAVFHRMRICDEADTLSDNLWPRISKQEKHDIDGVLLNLSDFVHSSMFYRAPALHDFFEMQLVNFIDYRIYIHLAKKGLIACIETPLGVYRYGVGVSLRNSIFNLIIEAVESAYDSDAKKSVVDLVVAQKCLMISKIAFKQGNNEIFIKYIRKSFFAKLVDVQQIMLFLIGFSPAFFVRLHDLKRRGKIFFL